MLLTRAQYLTTLHFNGTITPPEQEELSLLVLQLTDGEIQHLLGNAWAEHVPGTNLTDAAADDMLTTFFKPQPMENRSALALHVAADDNDGINPATAAMESTPVVKMQSTEKSRSRVLPLLLKISGAAAVIAAIVLLAKTPEATISKGVVKTFSAAAGERKNFQLPDGSLVTLNSGSSITISEQYGLASRDIYLQGEAFFDVKHDKNLPFIVHTPAMDVKAVGTAFDVKAYPGEKLTEASLVRGAVEVTLKQEQNRKLMLSPNEKVQWKLPVETAKKIADKNTGNSELAAEPARVIGLTKTDNGDIIETAWKENKLVFTDESFTNIAVLLERWYGAKIVFADSVISNYRFTGIFEREELQSVLGILQESRHFNYRIEHGAIIKVNLYK